MGRFRFAQALPPPLDPYFDARMAAGLPKPHRALIERQRSALYDDLAVLDEKLVELANERRRIVDTLTALHYLLWPTVPGLWGRRPPPPGEPPLAPLDAKARPIGGWELRHACRALLHRFGPLKLTQMHTLLHLFGFAVTGRDPVKTLADALGCDTDQGHVIRVARGLYQSADERHAYPQQYAIERALHADPLRWYRNYGDSDRDNAAVLTIGPPASG